MKASISTETLRKAIQKTHLIPKNRQLPVLADVCINFADGKATLRSTDLERLISIEIDAKVDMPFTTVLPRVTALKFLHGGNGTTTITVDKSSTNPSIAREGLGKINLTARKPEDFPPLPVTTLFEWHTLDAKWLCRMLGIVTITCDEEVSRPVLTGICCNDGAMASADGFRLAVVKSDKLTFGLGDKQVIIPRATADLVRRLFGKEDTLEVGFEITLDTGFNSSNLTAKMVHFKSGNTMLTSQLVNGSYPNYQQLIPASFGCKATFSAPLMLQRLQMIDEKLLSSGIVRFNIHKTKLGEDICSLSAHTEDEADYEMTLPIKFEGNESKIAFNHRFVMDAIKPFSVCHLEITSDSSPGKFTGDIEELTVVVMPMFVSWD